MGLLSMLLYLAIMFVVIFASFVVLKKYVFSKVPVNKFIPLAVAIILFLIQVFVKLDSIGTMVTTYFAVLSFLWFMDIQQTGGPKKNKEKKIVIKPKAKPNRVKNNK
ncbi:MAG: hypothetical protein ACRC2K_11610 [Clostridium sp.]